ARPAGRRLLYQIQRTSECSFAAAWVERPRIKPPACKVSRGPSPNVFLRIAASKCARKQASARFPRARRAAVTPAFRGKLAGMAAHGTVEVPPRELQYQKVLQSFLTGPGLKPLLRPWSLP